MGMGEADKALLSDVRNYLDITWEDEEGDRKLFGIICRGKSYLNNLCGEEQDYGMEGEARALLLDYCRYARNNMLEMFERNFLSQILSVQMQREVAAYAERTENGNI